MMKKLTLLIAVVVVLAIASAIYLKSVPSQPELAEKTTLSDNRKNCGSYLSQKGGNTDNMDRKCFLEAYSTCTPAKLYQEVIDPDNHTIKTTASVDTREGDRCRVSVHVENKFIIPENDIYYCYSVETTELDNYHIKIDDCEDRQPLIL